MTRRGAKVALMISALAIMIFIFTIDPKIALTLLLAASIVLALAFLFDMGPPWRSVEPVMAWLQSALAATAAMVDTALLLALLHVRLPLSIYIIAIAAQDAVFGWRWTMLRSERRVKVGKDLE